jgi:hypothetical protein
MRTKNPKMAQELRRLAKQGKLSERSWRKHQALNAPWGDNFVSPIYAAMVRGQEK